MSIRSHLLLVCSCVGILIAAGAPFDLDVDLPTGSPFDSIKVPKDTPTGGNPNDTETKGAPKPKEPDPNNPGGTVAEDPKKVPPPKPPSGLPGVKAPSTIDYQQHLGWKPDDDLVDWKDPLGPPTATGDRKEDDEKDPGVWDMKDYPPAVPNDLYVYCVTRFLMVMLHPAQVSESELTEFLIELGYPGYYAATACKNDGNLKKMAKAVLDSVGPMVKTPPRKPSGEIAQRVYMDLLSKYPYMPGFGSYILSQKSGDTLPVLLNIVNNERHPFLLRNAVFILRCFNNPEVVEPLRKLLTRTKDPVIRNRALAALVRWGDLKTAEWCAKKIRGSGTFRFYAVWALGRIGAVRYADAVMAAAKNVDTYGEFLIAAVPAIARIGRFADEKNRKKIIGFLINLERALPGIKDPPGWGGTGIMATRKPEPSNIRRKIIGEKIKIGLALLGRESEQNWMRKLGAQPGIQDGPIHVTNTNFFNETLEIIGDK